MPPSDAALPDAGTGNVFVFGASDGTGDENGPGGGDDGAAVATFPNGRCQPFSAGFATDSNTMVTSNRSRRYRRRKPARTSVLARVVDSEVPAGPLFVRGGPCDHGATSPE